MFIFHKTIKILQFDTQRMWKGDVQQSYSNIASKPAFVYCNPQRPEAQGNAHLCHVYAGKENTRIAITRVKKDKNMWMNVCIPAFKLFLLL